MLTQHAPLLRSTWSNNSSWTNTRALLKCDCGKPVHTDINTQIKPLRGKNVKLGDERKVAGKKSWKGGITTDTFCCKTQNQDEFYPHLNLIESKHPQDIILHGYNTGGHKLLD